MTFVVKNSHFQQPNKPKRIRSFNEIDFPELPDKMPAKEKRLIRALCEDINYWGKVIQRELGLTNWTVSFSLKDCQDGEFSGAAGWVEWHLLNRVAWVTMNYHNVSFWSKSEYQLAKILFHELCHVMLANLSNKSCGDFTENLDDMFQHDIIRTIENSLFEPFWEARLKQYCAPPAPKPKKKVKEVEKTEVEETEVIEEVEEAALPPKIKKKKAGKKE